MALLNENELKKHLSTKEYKSLYFLYGEEKMLVKSFTNLLVNKLLGNDKSEFNYHVFDNDSDLSDISVAVNVIPFMSENNLVVLKDFDIDSLKKDEFEDLLQIVVSKPESTTLIFAMPTLENSTKGNFKKIIEYVSKEGICAQLDRRTQLSLERTLCKWAKQAGAKMTEPTASRLIKNCGTDLYRLHTEIEKLSAYADGEEITVDMINKLVSEDLEAKVYDLFDFIVSKNSDKALRSLDILFYQREEPIMIAIVLGNAYVDAYRVRVARESDTSLKELASELGYKNRAWVLDKIVTKIRNISTDALRDSIEEIITTQEKLVSVTINGQVELEKLVSKLILLSEG